MRKYYNNGSHEIRLSDNDKIPEGYYPGRLNLFKSTGYFWINNGEVEKTIAKGSEIPENFKLGRLPKTVESIEKQKISVKSKHLHHYNNGEYELLISENDVIPEGFKLGRLPMTQSQKSKLSTSHKGLKHTELTKQKISKNSNNNRVKAKQTCLQRYEVEHVTQVAEIRSKGIETKRKNNTLNTSKPENVLYKSLCEEFGKENVIRNFKDKSRYPYYCDFYIKSEDLFIELNAHWTHGPKAFNETDSECLKLLNEWEEKAKTSQFYQNAIKTWTIRDVEKLKIARSNNLNYKVIYNY